MSDETTLLSCPWCGKRQAIHKEFGGWILNTTSHDRKCIMRKLLSFGMGGGLVFTSKAEAIAAWNTRAYLNPDGLPAGLTLSEDGALLDWRGENYVKQSTLGSGVCENISDPPSGFLCSECGWGDFNEPSHMLMTAKFTNNDRGPSYCPNCGRKVER